MEQDAFEQSERYKYFMRTEPRKAEGPVETDEQGRRYQQWDIGMVRNAKDRRSERVYLDPIPHILIPGAKPLQGWYKDKFSPPNVRPRPCMTEAVLTEPYGGTCPVKCGFCLPAGSTVDTPTGAKRIECLRVGDKVWGRGLYGRVLTSVVGACGRSVQSLILLDLPGGVRIRLTPDHPVYSVSRGWTAASDLKAGEKIEIDEDLWYLWGPYSFWRGLVLRGLFKATPQESDDPAKSGSAGHGLRSTLLCGLQAATCLRQIRRLLLPLCRGSVRADFCCNERESTWKEASATLFHMWKAGAAKTQKVVRRMFDRATAYSSIGQPTWEETKRYSKAIGICGETPGSYAWSSKPSYWKEQVRSLESKDERTYAERPDGVPCLQTRGVQGGTYEIRLGKAHSRVLRQKRHCVGVRTAHFGSGVSHVPARFLAPRDWNLRGSERLLSPGGTRAVADFQNSIPSRSLGPESLGRQGSIEVQAVSNMPGSVEVYDIQTGTENFYSQGVLLHNCYVNSGTRGYRAQGLTTVPMNYGDYVRKSLAKMKTSAAGYFSSFMEPFLPLEEIYHNTQRGAEAFAEVGLPVFFLSRMLYPDWAYDLLRRNPHSYAQMSLNAPDEHRWRRLSPWAPPLESMFQQVTALHKAGIYVSIQVNPIIPGVVEPKDIVELIHTLARRGADHLIFKFCEISHSSKQAFIDIMQRQFGPAAGQRLRSLMHCVIGAQTTIDETYRIEALDWFSRECRRARVTMATCYEYRYARHATGEIINKTGVSLGSKYLTADQCHGHKVPVYTRSAFDVSFEPVAECPPSGCLTCGDGNEESRGRCGSLVWGHASAHRAADYRHGVYEDVPVDNPKPTFPIIGQEPRSLF